MSLQYEMAGQGPVKVIAIHDWMSTLRSYDAIRPHINETKFSYAFIDLRGYGRSRSIDGAHSAAEAASDVTELADRLGWEKFHIIGHSMSGMIAQRVCVDAASRVKSLLAITPVTAAGVPLDADGTALFRGAATEDEQWLTVAKMVTAGRLPERLYRTKLAQFRASVSPEAFLKFLDMWTKTDSSAEMQGMPMPALALLGRHDIPAFTEEVMQQTLGQWFRNLTIEVIESSGHYPMTETPPYFVAAIERFMASAE